MVSLHLYEHSAQEVAGTMRAALLILVSMWWVVWSITNRIPQALHPPTISLEEYGVVLEPEHIMSTADMTRVHQGFRVPIPHQDNEIGYKVPVLTLCEKYLKFGVPFEKYVRASAR